MAGNVVTFYSYKGGVGRSFALANVGAILSRWGFRVLCIDWDLDAPGLTYYFRDWLSRPPLGGVVDMISEWERGGIGDYDQHIIDVCLPDIRGDLHILPAGSSGADYIDSAQSLNWSWLYEERDLGGFLEARRRHWSAEYDFVLIDSRTGITDIGAVCTAQLPDVLVMLFTANRQSLDGTLDVAKRVEKARNGLPYDRARLSIVPVPARFDETEEYDRAVEWKDRFQTQLASLYSGWLWREMPVEKVLSYTTVPYVSAWSFGEGLAALSEREPTPRQISYSFEVIAALIAHNLDRTDLLDTSRESYIAAAEREGLLRHGNVSYDVFVSSSAADRAVARKLVTELRNRGGLRVNFDAEMASNDDSWTEAIEEALTQSRHMVALVGSHSDKADFTIPAQFFRQTLDDDVRRLLIPCYLPGARRDALPGFFGSIKGLTIDPTDVGSTAEAIIYAVAAAREPHGLAQTLPAFTETHRLPGSLPSVWNVPPRNPAFTGRDRMLVDLRQALVSGGRAVVYALQGMGGVGKTQLAIEYAYRFAGEYELVWWIASQQPELIGEQFAALATAVGVADADTDVPAAVTSVKGFLRAADRLLLVFDNVEAREDIDPWLPGGSGHVVVTSRSPVWTGVAQPVRVDVFARSESMALLRTHLPQVGEAEADELADALGDLPLAVAQAAELLAETGLRVPDYLQTLDEHAADLLGDRPPVGYPVPLGAAIRVAAERLNREDPAAGQLLTLCAFLAPEAVPLPLFRDVPDQVLPEPLATTARSAIALERTVGHITRYGLARPTADGPVLHRLTQAILRDTFTPEQRTTYRQQVDQLLIAARPDDGNDPAHWPRWTRLMPHILASDPGATTNIQLRYLACSAVWHLLARGDARTALPLAHNLHTEWTDRYGPDDDSTLFASTMLAYAHRQLGQHQLAHALDEDALDRRRRVFGDDHPDTLTSANNLAIDLDELGQHEQARALDEDTLNRRRRILGHDHPATLTSANNLAVDLRQLGQYEQARAVNEDTLTRRRRILGNDHPDTLTSANNLAVDLAELGQYEQARAVNEDTLNRRRRILGHDHPDTLTSAQNLAVDLRQLGQHEQARALDEDTLNRRRRILGHDHPDTLTSAQNLAVDLRQLGQHEQARAL
ncbi:FxSxx-COOH system tetratricopeptide repeat protein, partial [Micromonospora taraxaci]